MERKPNRRGDRYEIRRQLGPGSFGTVRMAYDDVLGRGMAHEHVVRWLV